MSWLCIWTVKILLLLLFPSIVQGSFLGKVRNTLVFFVVFFFFFVCLLFLFIYFFFFEKNSIKITRSIIRS